MRKRKKQTNKTRQRKGRINKNKSKIIALILCMAMLLMVIGIIYNSAPRISNAFYNMTKDLGFVIKDISIDGRNHTDSKKIAKALKINKGMPILAVSLQDLKNRLEELEWIKNVTIERRLPDKIHISISESIPVALGQRDRKLYIIDDEGSVIHEKDLEPYLDLPIIIGDGAEIYANSLIKMLKKDAELFKLIHSIIRVSERRWNIRFNNGIEVKLPEENIEKAWQKVINLHKQKTLFLPDNAAVDLRVANKIFIEKK
jgi:cell division protein FtsQ